MDGSTSLITAPIFAGFVGGASQRVTMGYPTKVDGWIANVSNNHNIVLVYRYKILTRNHALWRLFYARLILHPPKKQFIYFEMGTHNGGISPVVDQCRSGQSKSWDPPSRSPSPPKKRAREAPEETAPMKVRFRCIRLSSVAKYGNMNPFMPC